MNISEMCRKCVGNMLKIYQKYIRNNDYIDGVKQKIFTSSSK
jgi:hypothetical protein